MEELRAHWIRIVTQKPGCSSAALVALDNARITTVGKSQIVKGRLGGCTILVQLHILCSARSHNHDFPHNEGHNYTKVAQRASNGAFEDQKQSLVNFSTKKYPKTSDDRHSQAECNGL